MEKFKNLIEDVVIKKVEELMLQTQLEKKKS